MENFEAITAAKALACLAWADGHLSSEEEKKFTQFMSQVVKNFSQEEIKGFLSKNKAISSELELEISKMSLPAFAEFVSAAFAIINCDRPAKQSEEDLLRQIARQRIGEENSSKIFEWYMHVSKADRIFDEIFCTGEK